MTVLGGQGATKKLIILHAFPLIKATLNKGAGQCLKVILEILT